MSKTKINSWKDCTDSRKVESFCVNQGMELRNTSGSHVIVKGPDNSTQCFYRHGNGEISSGVAHALYSWFKKLGVVLIFLSCPASFWVMTHQQEVKEFLIYWNFIS